ncbi:MAG: MgtC/SapB family protein [Pseudomonadota bacterium]
MNDLTAHSLVDGVIAIGLGVFIGLEREHSEVGPRSPGAGVGTGGGAGDRGRDQAGGGLGLGIGTVTAGANTDIAGAVTVGGAAAPTGGAHAAGAAAANDNDDSAPSPKHIGAEHLGVRTFALVALLGWLCALLEPWARGISLVGLAVGGALIGLQYVRTWTWGSGITTEVAALVTFCLGLLVQRNRLLTVGMALAVTLLLISKPWMRRFVARIERRELTATLQLAIMLAVVLPLLPDEARDPWGVLAPRRLGLFVVLIAGMSFVGYVLSRTFGTRNAAGMSGLLGGIVSSTAVTAAMAQRVRQAPGHVVSAQLTTFLANAVMFARVILVCAVLSPRTAAQAAIPMGTMGLVMLAAAAWKWNTLRRAGGAPEGEIGLRNPFALLPALKWGALLAFILVVVAIARQQFGERGLIAAAALSGLADVDAINVAVSRQSAAGTLDINLAVLALTVATMSSMISKAIISLASGNRRYGRPIAMVFAAAMATGLIAVLVF